MDNERPLDYATQRAERGGAISGSSITFNGAGTWMLGLFVFAVLLLALGGAWYANTQAASAANQAERAWERADIAEREARVAQDKLQYYQILLIQKGVIRAEEIHQ